MTVIRLPGYDTGSKRKRSGVFATERIYENARLLYPKGAEIRPEDVERLGYGKPVEAVEAPKVDAKPKTQRRSAAPKRTAKPRAPKKPVEVDPDAPPKVQRGKRGKPVTAAPVVPPDEGDDD